MIQICLAFAIGLVVGVVVGIFAISLVSMNRIDEGGGYE